LLLLQTIALLCCCIFYGRQECSGCCLHVISSRGPLGRFYLCQTLHQVG
jgi:hypothetical protein